LQLDASASSIIDPTAGPGISPVPAAFSRHLLRRLAALIADAADADQWAITIGNWQEVGTSGMGELVPEEWLISLNGGRRAVYYLAIPLEGSSASLGQVRLATIRPCGFSPDQVRRAQAMVDWAAELLSRPHELPEAV
jgi:hypothetical protein